MSEMPASSPCQAPPGYWSDEAQPRLTLVVIRTGQVEQVKHFYEAIGLGFAAERHGQGPLHYAATLGEVVFEIYPLADSASVADGSMRLGFVVSDLQKTLKNLGVEAREGKAVVQDPDGRKVEIRQASTACK